MKLVSIIIVIWINYVVHAWKKPQEIPISPNCTISYDKTEERFYDCQVNDTSFYGWFAVNKTFGLDCMRDDNTMSELSINAITMPIFQQHVRFKNVTISNCLPVSTHSYAEPLSAININTSINRLILQFDQNIPLHTSYFAGLTVESIEIEYSMFHDDTVYFDINILKPIEHLSEINLAGVILPPMPEWNKLKSITLSNVEPEKALQPWGECTHLLNLTIIKCHAEVLPNGWLANCSRLYSLTLTKFEKLWHLPRGMLEGAHALHSLTVSDSHVRDFPADFLSYTTELRFLDLSLNSIAFFSSNRIFSSVPLLEELDLSYNQFLFPAVQDFAPLTSLRSLSIDYGFQTDLSDFNQTVKWPKLPALQRLSLNYNDFPQLWSGLHDSMPSLKVLNLTANNITTLTYRELQQIRAGGWEVDLRENNLDSIWFEQNDYEAAVKQGYNTSDQAILRLSPLLDCNCRWYWFMRLLLERPGYVLLPQLQCTTRLGVPVDPIPYTDVSPKEMLCQLREPDCAVGCECFRREPDNLTYAYCSGAGMNQIPQINNLFELHLANNHISTLHATDLPDTLSETWTEHTHPVFTHHKRSRPFLDLQYNRLTGVNAETASKMFAVSSRTFRFTGNPIICDCNNHALIAVLQQHSTQVLDYENVTCVDKRSMRDISIDELCLANHVSLIASTIGAFAILLVILLALYHGYQREVHVILRRWGWSWCINAEKLDRHKAYDVFISFAFGDAPFIINELVPKLETDPFGLKVCVHYRDWVVGEWIPTQIARSVEESRRTIIVLSKNFLASVWALLEFRTAHKQALKDRCSRLVVIMLEDIIGDQRIDPELRAYLVTNTYITRDDPRFWEKLQQALPNQQNIRDKIAEDHATGQEVIRLVKESDPPIKLRTSAVIEIPSNNNDIDENLKSNEDCL